MKKPDPLTRKQFERTLLNQSSTVTGRLKPREKTQENANEGRVNCHACEFFFVTWQTATPYGCNAHGFKSAQIPSFVVFSSSGKHCLLYRPKPGSS